MAATTLVYDTYGYTTDDGDRAGIRINQLTLALQTTAPTTTGFTVKGTLRSSQGNRQFGIKPRYLRLSRKGGAAPFIKTLYTNLPVLLPADFDAFVEKSDIVVDGNTYKILKKVNERYN